MENADSVEWCSGGLQTSVIYGAACILESTWSEERSRFRELLDIQLLLVYGILLKFSSSPVPYVVCVRTHTVH